MTSENLLALIRVADEAVQAKTGEPLNDVQKSILEQVLAAKKLKDIQVYGYAETTVQRDFCPKLWKILSDASGQEVRFNTVRLVLEKLTQQTPIAPLPMAADRPAPPPVSPTHRVLHNLPAPECTTFIGREEELNRLLGLLSPDYAAHIISVDGIGGVGKTTLVVEAAYRCLSASSGQTQPRPIASHNIASHNIASHNIASHNIASHSTRNSDRRSERPHGRTSARPGDRPDDRSIERFKPPLFDAIIFTSAKEFRLTPFGLLRSLAPRRTLNDVFRQIASVIEELDITGASFEEQLDLIRHTLARYRTLLIIDNLETVRDQQDVLAFLYELPPTVKAVITTREQIIFVPVRLSSMSPADGISLIQHEAQTKGVPLSTEDSLRLYQATGGIPVAISYAIGQLANGYPIREMLHNITQSTGDIARFCFETSVQPLQGKPAHQLLMALALFPAAVGQEAVISVALPDGDPTQMQQDLARLRGLSLVKQEHDRYSMLPLTREYALAALNAHPEFAKVARQRWLNWYLNFSKTYADQDASEWQGQRFEELEIEWQNLQAVMEWCMAEGYYTEFRQLWQNLKKYTQVRGRHISRLGCWDDRLTWTAWLLQTGEDQQDWLTVTQTLLDRAWTLTSIGKPKQLEEAEELLNRTWELRHYQSPSFHVNVAKAIAVLFIQQQRFAEAQTWLTEATSRLGDSNLAGEDRTRHAMQLLYYRGEVLFKLQQYPSAQEQFELALKQAQQISSLRSISMIQNWLADIAIEQGNYEQAQTLLEAGLREAEARRDRTRMAYCQYSLAELAYAQGLALETISWATQALENFEALGMAPEAEEVQSLLRSAEGLG